MNIFLGENKYHYQCDISFSFCFNFAPNSLKYFKLSRCRSSTRVCFICNTGLLIMYAQRQTLLIAMRSYHSSSSSYLFCYIKFCLSALFSAENITRYLRNKCLADLQTSSFIILKCGSRI